MGFRKDIWCLAGAKALCMTMSTKSLMSYCISASVSPHPLPPRQKEENNIIIMKIEFEGRRRTNCVSVSSYWTVTLFPGRCACTLEKIEYIIIIDNNNNNNSLFVRRKIAYRYDLILEASRISKRTSKTVIVATTTVETSWVENLKSEKPSKMILGKARQ